MYPAETIERVIKELRANPIIDTKTTELMIQQIEDGTVVGEQFVKEYLEIEQEQ